KCKQQENPIKQKYSDTLKEQFDPYEFPRETHLLCELWWGENGRSWTHWVRNYYDDDRHAEEYFLNEIFELRSNRSCHISWYLSWSPCADCCDEILSFLRRCPNVHMDIRVARLYYTNIEANRRGLRVNYLASISPDYSYCWDNFVQRDDDDDDYDDDDDWTWNFAPEISRNRRSVYLLYEIRWRRRSIWRNWCSSNPHQHAEVNFLENCFNNRPQVPCSITWFLSASPCGNCSRRIVEFLRSHPNVTLRIYAARLFRHHDNRNREGLRNLMRNEVTYREKEASLAIHTSFRSCQLHPNWFPLVAGEEKEACLKETFRSWNGRVPFSVYVLLAW
uniref:C->U-editing enzyme APOBEC-1 n=1 Tax=Malurus cyaneus samueli TaxID=2593467 RepID=A0A8C5TSA7_9PASS